jgi:hypothetical protein
MDWARNALERNPSIEIVATDSDAEVFTVRDKSTGEVRALELDELVAVPRSQLLAAASTGAASDQTAGSQLAPEPSPPPPVAAEVPPQPDRTAQSAEQPEATADKTAPYTIERSDGQVKVTGPGVSIVSSGPHSTAGSAIASDQGAEPIICEGRRMLHLDNRNLIVDGDAITARGGCELHITNSRIVASGTALIVQDATVHISNSHIEGSTASFAAADGAKMFIRSSQFRGVSRRGEGATIQDQGANRW